LGTKVLAAQSFQKNECVQEAESAPRPGPGVEPKSLSHSEISGSGAITRMIRTLLHDSGIEFTAINTDAPAQALPLTPVHPLPQLSGTLVRRMSTRGTPQPISLSLSM
jgi:hypothetical protein